MPYLTERQGALAEELVPARRTAGSDFEAVGCDSADNDSKYRNACPGGIPEFFAAAIAAACRRQIKMIGFMLGSVLNHYVIP